MVIHECAQHVLLADTCASGASGIERSHRVGEALAEAFGHACEDGYERLVG